MNHYLMRTLRKPAFDPAVIEPHYAFLDRLRERGQLKLADPLTDRSGGACLLRAGSLEATRAIADADAVHTSGSSVVPRASGARNRHVSLCVRTKTRR